MTLAYEAFASPDFGDTPCDLRVTEARKHYPGFSLHDVSLSVPRGSVVGLIGQNGAGKTTLMKLIMGMARGDSGRVELFGNDVSSLPDTDLAQLKQRVAHVSTMTSYPQVMAIAEVAGLYQRAYPRFDMRRFADIAARMGLLPSGPDALRSPAARKKVKELSRGMGMKLQLSCALATNADLLVMDEPTAGLDPVVRDEVLGLIRSWMEDEGHSALISSHITNDLERLADYLVFIDGGRVLLSCDRDTLLAAGIARLRTPELERVIADGLFPSSSLRVLRRELACDLLVPNREAFRRSYPDFICDPASIDDVMVLLVKGKVS